MKLKFESIGLAMIAQNEVDHIAPSIAQFFQVVDDIVVVDGGSQDGTGDWARKMGARVLERPFDNDFAAQKNFAIENLDTDWVYLHDPDERIEPTLFDIIRAITIKDGQEWLYLHGNILPDSGELYDCIGIPRRNYIDGVMTDTYPDYQYRLFKQYCRFQKPVHEELVGFSKRTELDFKRKTLEDPPRFNILHYKSAIKQKEQNILYDKIESKKDR